MKKIVLAVTLLILMGSVPLFANEFSADVVSDMPMMQDMGKVYHKNSDITRNESMGMIHIMKRPKVYQIVPDTKKYYMSDVNELKKKNPAMDMDMKNFYQWANRNNMKKIGTETLEGYPCKIYEGDFRFDETQPSGHMTFWFSDRLQYPLKTKLVLPPPAGAMTTWLKNIKEGKQPETLFDVPKGYTQAASMEEAMGMPDMGAFMNGAGNMEGLQDGGAANGDKMPSKEEMEKMMKQMQEMMKNMQKKQ